MALTQQQAAQALQQAGVNVFNLTVDGNGAVSGQVGSEADKAKAASTLSGLTGTAVTNNLQVVGGGSSSGSQSYTVKSGDTLSKIAKHFYGDASKWHAIHAANKAAIPNPDLIQVGQELTIPAAQ